MIKIAGPVNGTHPAAFKSLLKKQLGGEVWKGGRARGDAPRGSTCLKKSRTHRAVALAASPSPKQSCLQSWWPSLLMNSRIFHDGSTVWVFLCLFINYLGHRMPERAVPSPGRRLGNEIPRPLQSHGLSSVRCPVDVSKPPLTKEHTKGCKFPESSFFPHFGCRHSPSRSRGARLVLLLVAEQLFEVVFPRHDKRKAIKTRFFGQRERS